ncbi:MAG: NAD(P)-dependent oxidoreductase [Rhodospirillaceae bacterium]
MKALPMFLVVRGKPVLIVGGTEAAAAKARLAHRAGADVQVVAEIADEALLRMAEARQITLLSDMPTDHALAAIKVVYIAGEDAQADIALAHRLRQIGLLVNVVDKPSECDFTTPAVIDRDPVLVAVGTEGTSPVLARRIRAAIDRLLPTRLGGLARLAGDLRGDVAERVPAEERRRFWEAFMDGAPARSALEGDPATARQQAEHLMDGFAQQAATPNPMAAHGDRVVHLLAAQFADADLLTVRAHRLLESADVIVHDPSVSEAVMDRARRDALRLPIETAGSAKAIAEQLDGEAAPGRMVLWLFAAPAAGTGLPEKVARHLEKRGLVAERVADVLGSFPKAAVKDVGPVRAGHRSGPCADPIADPWSLAFPVPFISHASPTGSSGDCGPAQDRPKRAAEPGEHQGVHP